MRDHLGNPLFSGQPEYARGVLLLDDCEGTFNWLEGGTGGDDVHAFATVAAFTGANGLHLKTRTTDAALDDAVYVQRLFAYPESGLLVARIRVAVPDKSKVKQVTLQIGHDTGAGQYLASLLWRPYGTGCYYVNSANNAVNLDGFEADTMSSAWLNMELTVNALTHQYLAAAWNGFRASLANVPIYNPAGGVYRCAWITLTVIAQGAAAAEGYFDNIYVGEFLDV